MNEMFPVRPLWADDPDLLSPARAKEVFEHYGATKVNVRAKPSGKMWVFFSFLGRARVWGLRLGALERNVARELARDLRIEH